jgi:hypothetical protein
MKRNVNLIVLTCEIAAIIILHAVKMNQHPDPAQLSSVRAASGKSAAIVRPFQLLSIK